MLNTLMIKLFYSFLFVFLFLQNLTAQVEYSVQAGANSSFFVHSNEGISSHTPYEDHTIDKPESLEIRGVIGLETAFILHPRLALGINLDFNWRSANTKFYDHFTWSATPPVTEVKIHYPDQIESYSARLGVGIDWFVIDQKFFLSLGISNDFVMLSKSYHTQGLKASSEEDNYFDDHVFMEEQMIEYDPNLNLSGIFGLGVRFKRFDVMLNFYGGFSKVKRDEYATLYQQTVELKIGYCFNRN